MANGKFQCRERLEWDFYRLSKTPVRLNSSGSFSAANGLSGISTTLNVPGADCIAPFPFQCRERLEWDFYKGSPSQTVSSLANPFQCRERLEWDFYVTFDPISVQPVEVVVNDMFQCRERLEWDFYSSRQNP